MRVRVSDPSLLSDLCNYLSRRGCAAVEAGEDESNVLLPGAPSSFAEATMLMAEIDLWRAKRSGVEVSGSTKALTRTYPPRYSSA
jgi:hypothetical protein